MPHFDYFPRPGETDPYESLVTQVYFFRNKVFVSIFAFFMKFWTLRRIFWKKYTYRYHRLRRATFGHFWNFPMITNIWLSCENYYNGILHKILFLGYLGTTWLFTKLAGSSGEDSEIFFENNWKLLFCNNVSKPSRNGNFLPYLRGEIGQENDKLEIVILRTVSSLFM